MLYRTGRRQNGGALALLDSQMNAAPCQALRPWATWRACETRGVALPIPSSYHPATAPSFLQCGVGHLARVLNTLLVEHIRGLLPSLRNKIGGWPAIGRFWQWFLGVPPGGTSVACCPPCATRSVRALGRCRSLELHHPMHEPWVRQPQAHICPAPFCYVAAITFPPQLCPRTA